MALDRSELAKRISHTGPRDQVRGSLFHAVLSEVDRVGPHGLAKRHPGGWSELNFYPAAEWLELIWDASDALESILGSPAAALQTLGVAVAVRFLNSLAGRLATERALGMDPIARLEQAPAVYGAAVTYGQRRAERLDACRGVLRYENEIAPPPFHEGVLRAACGAGGFAVDVEASGAGLLALEARVTWRR